MLVAGAMAATCPASVMKTPAEAARAPVGATYTTTGTSALRIRCAMLRIDFSSPPGVSRRMTRARAPSARARSMADSTSRTVTGLITPSMVRTSTRGALALTATAPARATTSEGHEPPAGGTDGRHRPRAN